VIGGLIRDVFQGIWFFVSFVCPYKATILEDKKKSIYYLFIYFIYLSIF
jgi:hypothetical protein